MNDDIIILPPSAQSGSGRPSRRFPWWTPLTIGVITILVGVGLLVWPFFAATWLLAVLFGTLLVANGVALLVSAGGAGGAATVGGLLLIVLGVLAVVFPEVTVSAFVSFFGVVLLVLGVLGLAIAARLSVLATVPAIFAILAGIAAIVWPQFALTVIAVACGVIAVLVGAWIISLALKLRRVRITPRQ